MRTVWSGDPDAPKEILNMQALAVEKPACGESIGPGRVGPQRGYRAV